MVFRNEFLTNFYISKQIGVFFCNLYNFIWLAFQRKPRKNSIFAFFATFFISRFYFQFKLQVNNTIFSFTVKLLIIFWKILPKDFSLPCLVFSQLNDNQVSLSIFVSCLKWGHFDPISLLFLQQKPLIESIFFLRQIIPDKISDKLAKGVF